MLMKHDIEKLEEKAEEVRRAKDIGTRSPIGKDIFNIIENIYKSYLIMYPLKSNNIAGFTRKSQIDIQIFINTSLDRLYQNFVGAHELYHLIEFKDNNKAKDFIICNQSDVCEELDSISDKKEELEANYFAAAFLLPKSVMIERFKERVIKIEKDEDYLLEIIKIQYEYEIPFKTVVKRLKELNLINTNKYKSLKIYEEKIEKYYDMLDDVVADKLKEMSASSNRKFHTLNTPKLAADAYKQSYISFDKSKYIIEQYGKKTEQFDINEEEVIPLNFDFSLFDDNGELYE